MVTSCMHYHEEYLPADFAQICPMKFSDYGKHDVLISIMATNLYLNIWPIQYSHYNTHTR